MVGLDFLISFHLHDRHGRAAAQNARQLAAMLRIKMHDHHKGSARPIRKLAEESLQRLHAAGGSPHRNDGRLSPPILWCGHLVRPRMPAKPT